jgi:hypothetical protein
MPESSKQEIFDAFIKDHTDKLLFLKRRFYYLKSIFDELSDRCAETFPVENDIIWQMVSDSHDMLVIDLCSFCKKMYSPGGFFNRLKSHVALLRVPTKKSIKTTPGVVTGYHNKADLERIRGMLDEHERNQVVEDTRKTLSRLFPGWSTGKVTPDHVDALKSQFNNTLNDLKADRTKNRAHRFEEERPAPHVDFKRIREIFEEVEGIFNGLTLVVGRRTLAFTDVSYTSAQEAARDVVDLVLHGPIVHVLHEFSIAESLEKADPLSGYYHLFRERYYRKKGRIIWRNSKQGS